MTTLTMPATARRSDPVGSFEAADSITPFKGRESRTATLEVLRLFGKSGASADQVCDRQQTLWREGKYEHGYTAQRIRTELKWHCDQGTVEVIGRRVMPGHSQKVSIYREVVTA